jgi:tRNA threonylcarbamoyl adenosine modification protein (Sua5/YciO/YrdC/YwlC family)
MEIIKLDTLRNVEQKTINLIADYLLHGKIIAYPTDTTYGIGCLATDKKAISRIYRIKKRKSGLPLLVLAASYCMLKKYFFINKEQEKHLRKTWAPRTPLGFEKKLIIKKDEKAVSFILPIKDHVFPDNLVAADSSAGVRLPKNEFLIKIIKKVGIPLVSTSLNISGKEIVRNPERIAEQFYELPDLLVDAGLQSGKPSEIYDIRDMGNIKKLR